MRHSSLYLPHTTRPTHWQQTLFYFDDPVRVKQDDTISGAIAISSNQQYARFIDFRIAAAVNGAARVEKAFELRES